MSEVSPLRRQNTHFFERVVGQSASVSFHARLDMNKDDEVPMNRPLNY